MGLTRSRAFAAVVVTFGVAVLPGGPPQAQTRGERDDGPTGSALIHQGHVSACNGIYHREDQDGAIDGPPRFILTRSYLSRYHVLKEFGIGTTNNAEWYLRGDSETVQWAELILEDGNRIRFTRTSPGTTYTGARFVNGGSDPSSRWASFNGATLEFTRDAKWLIRLKDRREALFRHCAATGSDRCALEELRYPDGGTVWFDRNSDGRVKLIQSGRQRIGLTYDARKRIARLIVDGGEQVDYTYDDRDHLIRAQSSSGVVREYTYGPHDELLTVREPGRFVQNRYDENLRVIHQDSDRTLPSGEIRRFTWEFAYTIKDGVVVETNVIESDGTHSREPSCS